MAQKKRSPKTQSPGRLGAKKSAKKTSKRPPYQRAVKIKRYTMNCPLYLVPMFEKRVVECPYRSDSDYLFALFIYDCWSRRPHRYTAQLMAQPSKIRDAAIAQIAEQFGKGECRSNDPSWWDHFVERIVREKLREAGLPDFV